MVQIAIITIPWDHYRGISILTTAVATVETMEAIEMLRLT
jgi:hypothetical protein